MPEMTEMQLLIQAPTKDILLKVMLVKPFLSVTTMIVATRVSIEWKKKYAMIC